MDKWLCLPGKRNESKSSGGIDRSGAASEWMSWCVEEAAGQWTGEGQTYEVL